MKPLSALGAVFLHLETPEIPMRVGSLMPLDLANPVWVDGGAPDRRFAGYLQSAHEELMTITEQR